MKHSNTTLIQKIQILCLKQKYSQALLLLKSSPFAPPLPPHLSYTQINTYSFLYKIQFPQTVLHLILFKKIWTLIALSSLAFLIQSSSLPISNPLFALLLGNLLLYSAILYSSQIFQKKPSPLFFHHLLLLLITLDTLLFFNHSFILHSPIPLNLSSSLKYYAFSSLALFTARSSLKKFPQKPYTPLILPLLFLPLAFLSLYQLCFLFNSSILPLAFLLYPPNPPLIPQPLPQPLLHSLLIAFFISFLPFPFSFLKYPHSFFLPYSKILSFLNQNPKFQNLPKSL